MSQLDHEYHRMGFCVPETCVFCIRDEAREAALDRRLEERDDGPDLSQTDEGVDEPWR